MKRHNLCHTRIYEIRKSMLKRCRNANHKSYNYYGGRGVKVCDEWSNNIDGAMNFYNWAINNGYADGLTIDRIDSNGDYEPNNCRWVTKQMQCWNQRAYKNVTGYAGVHIGKQNKFTASITVSNKAYHLGTFETAEEASKAYQKAKQIRDDGKWDNSPNFRLWG